MKGLKKGDHMSTAKNLKQKMKKVRINEAIIHELSEIFPDSLDSTPEQSLDISSTEEGIPSFQIHFFSELT
jgi:hypothetical protein